MPGTDVEQSEQSSVPALAGTPSSELSAEDIALPSLKLGQFMSDHVQEKIVPAGCLFTRLDQDDPDPAVLWEQGSEDLLRFHVLSLEKGKSVSEDGELVRFAYDDPDAPADAWVTYNYVIALPKVDPELPYKFLLTRTGKPAAQSINTVLIKNAASGPAHAIAFDLDCAERKNKKGKYFVPRAKHVEADPEDVEVAANLAAQIQPAAPTSEPAASVDEPAI